jgi:hypothetical protein
MPDEKPPSENVLTFAVPRHGLEATLENWIYRLVQSNDELASVLELLRDSYCLLLVGKPGEDDEVLAQVETALQNAAKTKNVV